MAGKSSPVVAPDEEMATFIRNRNLAKAQAWLPEPDTTIVATVVGLRLGSTEEYGDYPIIVYSLDNGEFIAVHAFHTLLRERLAELGTDIGKRQILSYLGTKASRKRVDSKGNPVEYHDYYVENAGEASATEGVATGFHF